MERNVEGTQTGFLSQITGKKAQHKADCRWLTPREEVVREAAVTESTMTYIGRRQGMVGDTDADFEVCAGEKVYEGGGHRKDA